MSNKFSFKFSLILKKINISPEKVFIDSKLFYV